MSDTPTGDPYIDPEIGDDGSDVARVQREEFEANVDDTPIPTPADGGKATKPQYIVIGDKLICQTSDGELAFPLRFKTKLLRQLRTFTDMDDTDQLFWLLEEVGQKDVADRMGELDIFETLGIVGEYFRRFEERSQAAMGESSGSQNS